MHLLQLQQHQVVLAFELGHLGSPLLGLLLCLGQRQLPVLQRCRLLALLQLALFQRALHLVQFDHLQPVLGRQPGGVGQAVLGALLRVCKGSVLGKQICRQLRMGCMRLCQRFGARRQLNLRLVGIGRQLALVEEQLFQLLLHLLQLQQQQRVLALQLGHVGKPLIDRLLDRQRCSGLGLQVRHQLLLRSLCLRQ